MRIRLLVLTTAFVALIAVGCSKTDTTDATVAGGGTTTPTSASTGTTRAAAGTSTIPAGTVPGAAGATTVAVADSALGTILVDGEGMTVYVFMKDTATTSACTGGCAEAWPAVVGASVDAGAGLDAGDFTTITGADGASQVVFYGHPLYTYAADNPGQTSGQGVGGNWYVVGADGNPITTAP